MKKGHYENHEGGDGRNNDRHIHHSRNNLYFKDKYNIFSHSISF